MNMTEKFAASFVAVAALSAVLFPSAGADSMKPAQATVVAAVANASSAISPLNSKETPDAQLNDLQYN